MESNWKSSLCHRGLHSVAAIFCPILYTGSNREGEWIILANASSFIRGSFSLPRLSYIWASPACRFWLFCLRTLVQILRVWPDSWVSVESPRLHFSKCSDSTKTNWKQETFWSLISRITNRAGLLLLIARV